MMVVEEQYRLKQSSWQIVKQRIQKTNTLSNAFLTELESVFFEPEKFEPHLFEKFELEEIFSYLKESHTYYLDIYLPKIENTLQQLYSKFGHQYLSIGILLIFIEKYKKELIQHIKHEEQVLFLFVDQLLKGNYSEKNKDFVLNHFIHTHNDNVIVQLNSLKEDLITFDPELKTNIVFRILFNQLGNFQQDLCIHALIEDSVFMDKILVHIHQFHKV